jgi:hypothetical protein
MIPTPTDRPSPARSELVIAGPSSETLTRRPSAVSAALIRLPASALEIWAESLSQVTLAKATVPVRLICADPPGPYGLAMLSIPGTAATLASAAFTADATAADRIVAPCHSATTLQRCSKHQRARLAMRMTSNVSAGTLVAPSPKWFRRLALVS